MPIVGGLDIHRKQLTFDYLDTGSGEVKRGQITPADRAHLRWWLVQFAGRDDVAFALEGCTGWRYVSEELAAAGVAAHVGQHRLIPRSPGAAKRHAKTDKTDSRHLRVAASCSAFSSSACRACSTSLFLRSTSAFCSTSCVAFSSSSRFVFCSSS